MTASTTHVQVAVDPGLASRRARLRADVALAARILATSWPLESFIAVNPLAGLEDRPFTEAVRVAEEAFGARGTLSLDELRAHHGTGRITDSDLRRALLLRFPELAAVTVPVGGTRVPSVDTLLVDLLHAPSLPPPSRSVRTVAEAVPSVAAAVDSQTTKWCAAYLDEGQAGWAMPGNQRGLYAAWRALAHRDRSVPGRVRRELAELPERADDALLAALDRLRIGPDEQRAQLRAELARLPGWAAHVRWRGENGAGVDLLSYLALRMTYAALLLPPGGARHQARSVVGQERSTSGRARFVADRLAAGPPTPEQMSALAAVLDRLPEHERPLVWLEAFEGHYRDELLTRLTGRLLPTSGDRQRPAAQLVTCIDVRSEGLRRQLEAVGPYETLGFAGFFAVAISFTDLAGGAPSALCPVLLKPRNEVKERPVPDGRDTAVRRLSGLRVLAGAEEGFHNAKDAAAGPFALAEAAGWLAGPVAAAKTVLAGPYGRARRGLQRSVVPPATTEVTAMDGFSPDERAQVAEVMLTMMGLTSGFARLVVLCGHGSTTENNPHGSSLDCGACGGSRGGPNARTATALLNDAAVRHCLADVGIEVPADTWFLAGEHDTATDRVRLLDRHLVPASHHGELDGLARDLERAGTALAAERCAVLPGARRSRSARGAARHVQARSTDWAQTYPEWGLAGNAAFVVGPRSMTVGLDLGRRVFLHSYEAAVDRDGAALETILTAPLVVGQWISAQYYFSSVDPQHFGAGSKTIHNVVGGIGVLSGQDGDLQLGLPWQSVGVGEQLVHEPVRLLAVVQAPLERIDAIVARNPVLQRLFGGSWMALAAREHDDDPWQRHTPHGWQPWSRPEGTA